MKSKSLIYTFVGILFFGFFASYVSAQESASSKARVETGGETLVGRVAPGESLPISVKLLNFWDNGRVDVLITYQIFNVENISIYESSETVAVETTASFIKMLQIPQDSLPGKYIVKTSVLYKGQLVEASASFPFTIEYKIFGLFKSDFIVYVSITTVIAFLMLFLGHFLIKKHKSNRLVALDYSSIPKEQRTFYELLSDTIVSMRLRVGDDAIFIAKNIPGLKIDSKTGRVLDITDKPSKIIARLVLDYEKLIGQRVSFSLRRK